MNKVKNKLSWLGFFPVITGAVRMVIYTMIVAGVHPYSFVYLMIVVLMICSIGAYYLFKFIQIRMFGNIGTLIFMLGGGILFLNNFLSWAFDLSFIVPGNYVLFIVSTGYCLLAIDAFLMKPPNRRAGWAFVILVFVPILAFIRFKLGLQDLAVRLSPNFIEGIGWLMLGLSILIRGQKTCIVCNQVVGAGDAYCSNCGNSMTSND